MTEKDFIINWLVRHRKVKNNQDYYPLFEKLKERFLYKGVCYRLLGQPFEKPDEQNLSAWCNSLEGANSLKRYAFTSLGYTDYEGITHLYEDEDTYLYYNQESSDIPFPYLLKEEVEGLNLLEAAKFYELPDYVIKMIEEVGEVIVLSDEY